MRGMRRGAALLAAVAFCGFATLGHSADIDRGLVLGAPVIEAGPVIERGVPCGSAQAQAFSSVWLGHFAGGSSTYLGPGQSIALDWHDEKLCFPTRRSCGRFITEMRRAYHRPEGYFTCLPIR